MNARDGITVPADDGDVVMMAGPTAALAAGTDPVLAALGRAEEQYLAVRAVWDRELAELQRLRDEAADAKEAERRAADEAGRLRAALDKERQRAARQKERAERTAAALKDIHRAL